MAPCPALIPKRAIHKLTWTGWQPTRIILRTLSELCHVTRMSPNIPTTRGHCREHLLRGSAFPLSASSGRVVNARRFLTRSLFVFMGKGPSQRNPCFVI